MAKIQALTQLLRVLAWPAVVLIGIWLLRREIRELFGRVREIEGPGAVKVTLDAKKLEEIIQEGQRDKTPPSAVAGRIIQSVNVLDKREARILRALLDDDGRGIHYYQTNYYRPALESLLAKGQVTKAGKGFELTQEGRRITKAYLLDVLNSLDVVAPK
jgi:hypothetical protein